MGRKAGATVVVSLAVIIAVAALFFGVPFAGDDPSKPTEDNESSSSDTDMPTEPTGNNESSPPETANILEEFTPPSPDTYPGQLDGDSNAFAGFIDVASEVGLGYETIDIVADIVDAHGVYVVDFNNNGYEDILLLGGYAPTLFENTGDGYTEHRQFTPDWEYEDMNALVAHFLDYNNNGYDDLLLVAPFAEPVLYENRNGEFIEANLSFGTEVPDFDPDPDADDFVPPDTTGTMTFPVAITSADFTGNGCLDIYIGNWAALGKQAMPTEDFVTVGENHPEVRPETTEGGENFLFAGDCEGFEDITDETGVGGSEFTLATSAADFTGNGHIDIHVGNDFTGDFLHENQGNGTFRTIDMGPDSDRNAMSSTAADMTGNHRLDLFVTNVYFDTPPPPADLIPVVLIALPDGNNLFANEGGGNFTDIAPDYGLEKGAWGWAATLADYTNDGHLDVIHASTYSNPPIAGSQPDVFRPPQVWNGTGDSWEKVSGFDIGFEEHNLRGVARVDYAGDGTLDFVAVGNPSSPRMSGVEPGQNRTFLYENQLESDDFLQLWVRNPDGVDRNAGVYIETDERIIYRENDARSDHMSQDSRLIHVGTAHETVERVIVEWPDGTITEYNSVEEGNRYILTPNAAERVD